MKSILAYCSLLCIASSCFAQNDPLVLDFKCDDRLALTTLDLLISTRQNGGYIPVAEWSQQVSSNEIVRKIYPLEGDVQYVILLVAEQGVQGTGLEIRNRMGEKLEYVNSLDDLQKNQIQFFYTPPADDDYRISFRLVNGEKAHTCMYMAILKGPPDSQ